ncbi:unnamed protein product [Adineta ricciae]|uniref:SWIM-type domain-containing protein n=1 Tax=Adineta ricciae TaxID=249248 RepID=A0A815WDN0_ADIRI|nr:unnamed protein product [Adineta ricciae]CAF1645661.1 unnamed protein product [Adineta ricciae]
MPRDERLKCVACDKNMVSNRKQVAGSGLWKLFLSARSLKRVEKDAAGCVDCRMKYLNWLKKVNGDFDQFDTRSEACFSNESSNVTDNSYENEDDMFFDRPADCINPTIKISVEYSHASHKYCVVCGLREIPLKVLSKDNRSLVFLKRGILIPNGARCCSDHLDNKQLIFDAIEKIPANGVRELECDANYIVELLNDFRLLINNKKTFDFDDMSSLNDQDYYNITGLRKDQFDNIVATLKSLRQSENRSVRVAIAIFCAKMRLGLANSVLATLFRMQDKRVITRIIHQVTRAFLSDFVPNHLGFGHISRQCVLKYHQTVMADVLLTDSNRQIVVVIDGTYLYVQKSMNNELQRRTYSLHKHRHLVKPMVITTTDGYILSVFGPYFSDHYNNDANIIEHCFRNNPQDMLDWLKEDDVVLVDRGFRNAIPTMENLGFRVAMLGFLNGRKQFSTEEANQSRLVTANRWVIESGAYQVRMARSYVQDHLTPSVFNDEELEFVVEMCSTIDDLVRVRFRSRHSNNKNYIATIQFDSMNEEPITGYYCTCISGAREIGCCAHVCAVLWHLGVQRGQVLSNTHPLSAINLLNSINDSIQYSESDEDTDDDDENEIDRENTSIDSETDLEYQTDDPDECSDSNSDDQ